MSVVFACIAPHGSEAIPELAGESLETFSETRKAMEELARLLNGYKPETIVIATPHGLRLEGMIGVITSEYAEGTLEENKRKVTLRCECDRKLAKEILENARRIKLPVVGANFGTSEGPASCMPMDWGTLIPLWFLVRRENDGIKVVIVTPSRRIPLKELVSFGEVISEVTAASEKRVAFVASADQGHAHRSDGPYGYNPASAEFDQLVKEAVQRNDLKPLLNLPSEFVENAKPDSLWQLAMLHGVLKRSQLVGCLLSYQVPTYYGMLCAAYSKM